MQVKHMAGHVIRRLNQISTQEFGKQMQAMGHDLTPVQFAALDAVNTYPGIDQAGLAEKIAYDRATIGGVVERLVKKNYVERGISPTDKRARVLTLSETGRQLYETVTPVVAALQDDILSGLSEEERKLFINLGLKVIENAEK